MKRYYSLSALLTGSICFIFTMLLTIPAVAQPSGGPYGPVPQEYSLPEVSGRIIYVSPDAKTENDGSSLEHPTTIEKAVKEAVTGDAIILRGGTYRTGNLIFNQGIIFQAYADEQPILKGTYVAKEWRSLRNGLWTIHWDHLFPMKPAGWWRREWAGKQTPLHRFNNDMVFVDGRFLQSAAYEGEVDENSFYIDYESGTVYIAQDPEDHLIEITAFDVAIHRVTEKVNGKKADHAGPVIRGITFTQYAYRAIEIEGKNPEGLSADTEHGKDVTGTTIEHCTISYCSRVAGYLRGDNLTLRNCLISNTSTEGIFLLSSSDVLLEKNIFEHNNIEHIEGYYPAAVKIFNQCYRVTCNDNLVRNHPWSNGIWYDVGNVDGIFTNNWIENVGHTDYEINRNGLWPSQNGFFFEISKGVICAGNVFINCDHGLMILNSSGARIWQNTFINSMVAIGRTNRSAVGDHFDWHPSTGPDVDEREGHVLCNNLMTGDRDFKRPMLFVWQHPSVCGILNEPQLTGMDHNVYVRSKNTFEEDLLLWAPANEEEVCTKAYRTLEDFQAEHTSFSKHDNIYISEKTPLFQGSHLLIFRLLSESPIHENGSALPEEIRKLLGETSETPYIGAYPPVK